MRALLIFLLIAPLVAGCVGSRDGEGTPVVDQGPGPAGPDRFPPPPGKDLSCPPSADDCSREYLNVTATPTTDRPWRLWVPVPVSEPGTSVDEWMANLTTLGPVRARPLETPRGMAIEVEGTGHLVLQTTARQFPLRGNLCCAEAYLDARWTTATNDSRDSAQLFIEGPFTRVEVLYEASSAWCERVDHFVLERPVEGWQALRMAQDEDHAHGAACE